MIPSLSTIIDWSLLFAILQNIELLSTLINQCRLWLAGRFKPFAMDCGYYCSSFLLLESSIRHYWRLLAIISQYQPLSVIIDYQLLVVLYHHWYVTNIFSTKKIDEWFISYLNFQLLLAIPYLLVIIDYQLTVAICHYCSLLYTWMIIPLSNWFFIIVSN